MRPSLRKVLKITGVVFAVAVCASGLVLYRCYASLDEALKCAVTVKREIPSQHLQRVVVVFEKDCGATTPFNTQVSIAPKDSQFSSDDFPPVLSIKGQHELAIRWLDDETVQIEIPKGVQIYRQEKQANGITVLYK